MTSPEWLDPEVLPPEAAAGPKQGRDAIAPPRWQMLLIGALIDVVDFVTWGPAGRRYGLPLGFLLAFCLLTMVRVPLRRRLVWSLLAGLYCAMPGTERLPLATLFSWWMAR